MAGDNNERIRCIRSVSLVRTFHFDRTKLTGTTCRVAPEKCAAAFPGVFAMIFPGLQSSSQTIIEFSAKCLAELFPICVTDAMIIEAAASCEHRQSHAAQKKKQTRTPLETVVAACEQGLGFRFKCGWAGVLLIIRALFARLGRSATPILSKMILMLDDLRPELQEVEDATIKLDIDSTLAAAARAVKPAAFLKTLPLNLDREKDAKARGRAYLLPLLKDARLSECDLAYFSNALLPLSDSLRAKAAACAEENRVIQAKVYETLAQQIWSLFPEFCNLPSDVSAAMTPAFVERTASELYGSPVLRPALCQGFYLLIDKALVVVGENVADEEVLRRQSDVEHMAKFATNMLSVLFNVFSQTPADSRGHVVEAIRARYAVSERNLRGADAAFRLLTLCRSSGLVRVVDVMQDIQATFRKVTTVLADALANLEKPSNDATFRPAHTMLDLALLMIPYLEVPLVTSLFSLVVPLLVSETAAEDPILQKKAYKVLRAIGDIEALKIGVLQSNIADIQKKLIDSSEVTTASAKKDRLLFMIQVVSLLPASDLSLIPSLVSEAVVSTKEVNERARNVAYDLLVAMGRRMSSGGVIVRSNIDAMCDAGENGQEHEAQTVPATIDEYFTMVVAGLAGSTAHMVSATIMALSRLLFEFKDSLGKALVHQLISTMHLFVMGNNKEMVRAALGFAKVITVSLPVDTLQPHLPQLITGILAWSNEHNSHFKSKVRHIFERLMRRFGYDAVQSHVPEESKKLVVNIKKRKERAKRKKNAAAAAAAADSDDDQGHAAHKRLPGSASGDAYEDVLYGSESEIDDTEDEDEEMASSAAAISAKGKKGPKKAQNKNADQWIKEDEDAPLDFLDHKVVSRRGRGDLASSFATGDDGRLVFAESESEDEAGAATASASIAAKEIANGYYEAVTSKDGFTRTSKNRIKFDNRKRGRDDDAEPMDIDQPDPPAGGVAGRKKRHQGRQQKAERIGQGYKAKVSLRFFSFFFFMVGGATKRTKR
ncbi:MAG: NUC173 domain-containing protein [Olpidium bornovanus]|uniref:NUC173 domain-containing protein n=1 Tax=Olpidium bornovanus TaxID=278681 RepID=A0A8H7ZY82_9FUNG|nr:MAG: NUC173 domain-containing protein [Olpidium bornovanus]